MITVALVAVIVAVISLVSAVGAAAVTAYTAYWSDKRKRHAESTAILDKYRDPLLIAAVALRHKIARLFLHEEGDKARGYKRSTVGLHASGPPVGRYEERSQEPAAQYEEEPPGLHEESDSDVNKYIVTHTAFLIGQFFAWVYIIRLESQFLSIQRTHKTSSLANAFYSIEAAWSKQPTKGKSTTFMLWRGEQSAIGELMTITTADGQHSCVGYAAFCWRWRRDQEFRKWFKDFARDVDSEGKSGRERLSAVNRGLQELEDALDPKGLFAANYHKWDPEQGML
jgi:hypothetical protein